MAIINPLADAQVSFATGIVNIVALLLVLATCRCAPVRLPEPVRRMNSYQVLLKYHCWYWWVFLLSVILHAVFAVSAFGVPFG